MVEILLATIVVCIIPGLFIFSSKTDFQYILNSFISYPCETGIHEGTCPVSFINQEFIIPKSIGPNHVKTCAETEVNSVLKMRFYVKYRENYFSLQKEKKLKAIF